MQLELTEYKPTYKPTELSRAEQARDLRMRKARIWAFRRSKWACPGALQRHWGAYYNPY